MNITILSENLKCDLKDLKNEHGLSLYIEKNNHHILFDTGKSDNFITNAKKLGVSLEEINIVIISHAHFDHIGGLISFLQINKKAKVYMKKEVLEDYYFLLLGIKKNISVDKKVFLKYSHRINFVNTFTEIVKGIYLFTEIDTYYTMPEGNKVLYLKKENKLVQDTFEHELIMVIQEVDEISIFTGCGHRGVANMIRTVRKTFQNMNIKAVIGGFHLIRIPFINMPSSEIDIETIVKVIKDEKIQKVYTGHCTGKNAYKKLKNLLGDTIEYLKLGTKINL